MTIEFINNHHALYPAVKMLGRKYASTLGFMPEGGFDDYAIGKCIITASENGVLMGYLMFRQTTRHGRIAIVHLAIDEQYRHNGIYTKLLDALRERFQDSGVQGMVLNCRKDYEAASAMWANYGFIAKGTKRSRSLETHYLTTWWYAFQQRDLFSIAYEESTKVRALMDLNVIVKLRDAEKGEVKLDAKEDPRCLLADWLVGETDLCYAPEVFNEINRDENLERMRETNTYVTGAFTEAIVDAEKGKREKKVDFENVVMGCVNAGGELYTVNAQKNILAFYGLTIEPEVATIHFLRIADGPLKGSLLCQIVTNTLQECVAGGQRKIVVMERYLDDDQKDALLRYGFLAEEDGTFVKHIRSEVITQREIGEMLRSAGLEPRSETWSKEQMVRMELSFFPLKIRDLDMPCYIIPIKQYWAGQLFDSAISGENLFGAIPSKLWSIENVYYRHTRPITEEAPARILWYVSGGGKMGTHKKMIVGCSYLTEVHTGKGQDLFRRFKRYGIYEWEHIYELCGREKDEDIRALKFSHTELFKRPVSYAMAQQLLAKNGYKTPNTFAGPVQVSKEVFFDMYEMGK